MAQRPHVRALSGIAAATLYAAPVQARNRDCAPLLDQRFSGLSGEAPRSLCRYQGQVVRAANIASECGGRS